MKPKPSKLYLVVTVLVLAMLACTIPGISAPTPITYPTPDLILTAIALTMTTGQASPIPPLLPTATPTSPVVSSPTPTSLSPTLPPTVTSVPTTIPTATATATQALPTLTPTRTATSTPSYAGPGMRPHYSVAGVFFDTPPDIDGNLGDWNLDFYLVNHVVWGVDMRKSPADLSGSMVIGWDEKYLYLGVRVKDDKYVQNAHGINLFKGDSLEVLLDTEVSEDFYLDILSDDDFQLGISPGSPKLGKNPEAYLWYPRELEGTRSKVKIATKQVDDGYHVEVAIPWSIFGVDPFRGQHFGFAVSISDNDKVGESVQQSMVSNVPTRWLADPTTWGDLTLVK